MEHHLPPVGTHSPRLILRGVMLRFQVHPNFSHPWSHVPRLFFLNPTAHDNSGSPKLPTLYSSYTASIYSLLNARPSVVGIVFQGNGPRF